MNTEKQPLFPQIPDKQSIYDGSALVPELFRRMEAMQDQITTFTVKGNERLTKLEQLAAERGEKWAHYTLEQKALREDFQRMETGLLNEFRISQELMRAMIEHDMSIEKAKLDFKLQLEQKDKEFESKVRESQLQNEQARKELMRGMWIKIGGVLVPVLTTLAAVISFLLQKWTGQ